MQVLVEEALADLIEKRKQARPRPQVIADYRASHDKYSGLYKKLAQHDYLTLAEVLAIPRARFDGTKPR